MLRESVKVTTTEGLHARPAAEFARLAQTPGHSVLVCKPGGQPGRGDSILTIMSLGAKSGEQIVIEVSGPDEESLLQSLKSVVSGSQIG